MKKFIWIMVICTLVLLGVIIAFSFLYVVPAQKTADKALAYFLIKDYDSLYDMNHSVVKKVVTREQIQEYVDKMSPLDTKEIKNIKGFLIGKFSNSGYSCLTFDIELKYERRTSVARVSVAKDGDQWSIFSFSFFPNVRQN